MNSLHLNVEVLGGSSIHDACKEACDLADRINVTVDFKFNGVTCIAHPGTDPGDLAKNWNAVLQSKFQHKFATGTTRQYIESGAEHE